MDKKKNGPKIRRRKSGEKEREYRNEGSSRFLKRK